MPSSLLPEKDGRKKANNQMRVLAAVFATFFVLIILVSCPPRVLAGNSEKRPFSGKLVILIVERLSINDLTYPGARYIVSRCPEWGLGFMTTRNPTPPLKSTELAGKEYITFCSGAPAAGTAASYLCLTEREREGFASWSEYARTGGTAGDKFVFEEVKCLAWQDVLRNNAKLKGTRPGLLGRTLEKEGIIRAVIGNADDATEKRRFAPLILCNEAGVVPLGDVTWSTLVLDRDFPGGWRADIVKILEALSASLEMADLVVVDFGDLARLERQSKCISDKRISELRAQSISRMDRLIRMIVKIIDLKTSALLVINPVASVEDRKERVYVTPVIAAGKTFGSGFLTSDSTRRDGLVSNLDLLPTVLSFFRIEQPRQTGGSKIRSAGKKGDLRELKNIHKRLTVSLRLKWYLMIALLILLLVILLFTIFGYLADYRKKYLSERSLQWLFPILKVSSLAVAAAPLAFLIVPATGISNPITFIISCLAFSILLGTGVDFFSRRFRKIDAFALLCVITVASIVFDLLSGSRFILFPLLGSSAFEGFRFYGITNAAVGLVLVAAIWAVAGYLQPEPLSFIGGGQESSVSKSVAESKKLTGYRKVSVVLFLVVVCFAIGLGPFGANFGGFLTGVFVFSFFLTGKPVMETKMRGASIAFLFCAGAAFLLLIDAFVFRTHAGKAVTGQFAGVLAILENKLTTQISQFSYFLLPSILLLSGIALLALWVKGGSDFPTFFWKKAAVHTFAFYSLLIGSLVGFVLNDTGTSLVGVMMLMNMAGLCYYFSSYRCLVARSQNSN